MKQWQSMWHGSYYTAHAYDENGYTGEWGYVNEPWQIPEVIYGPTGTKCQGTPPVSVCDKDYAFYCEYQAEVYPWKQVQPEHFSIIERWVRSEEDFCSWFEVVELVVAPTWVILSGLDFVQEYLPEGAPPEDIYKLVEKMKALGDQQVEEGGYISLKEIPIGCEEREQPELTDCEGGN